MSTLWALPILLTAAANADTPAAYPRTDLLIEAKELARPGVAPKFRLLDVRPAAKYLAGHIPGTERIEHDSWSKGFTVPPDRQAWVRRLGEAAILTLDTPVVVYGDDVREAARVWWILRYWGLKDVRMLNGGWAAWQVAGGPVEKGASRASAPPAGAGTALQLAPQPERLATMEQILKDLREKKFTIVDTRSEGEFCGDVKLAKRGGAIPGARHLEWVEVIDKKTQRFKPAPELARLFQAAGIDLARPTVTHCQSGGRASVTAFALELMGAHNVRNYYRSWAEWGNASDTPVVQPKR
jgi:thiosulfate/3-mercaptopyruvate sulfurtransferase